MGLTFADGAFGLNALENLESLDLSYCHLTNLPNTLLQNLP
jgi:Leucine-rich repeat (LRR) protein